MELVRYELAEGVATLEMNDGKANALSPTLLAGLNQALDRAQSDRAVVVLTGGRPGMFCAGFDLEIMRAGGRSAFNLVSSGFELALRILTFPTPVMVAAPGHTMAMGAFLALASDLRLISKGSFKVGLNEVAIGIAIPHAAMELCRQRLQPSHFSRSVLLSEIYAPEGAVEAGYFDRVVAPEELANEARTQALRLAKLDMRAHETTKLRARSQLVAAMREGLEADRLEFDRSQS